MIINLPPLCQNEPTRGQNEALDPLYTLKRVLAPEAFKIPSPLKTVQAPSKNVHDSPRWPKTLPNLSQSPPDLDFCASKPGF